MVVAVPVNAQVAGNAFFGTIIPAGNEKRPCVRGSVRDCRDGVHIPQWSAPAATATQALTSAQQFWATWRFRIDMPHASVPPVMQAYTKLALHQHLMC